MSLKLVPEVFLAQHAHCRLQWPLINYEPSLRRHLSYRDLNPALQSKVDPEGSYQEVLLIDPSFLHQGISIMIGNVSGQTHQIDGLMQERRNSSALAMELRLFSFIKMVTQYHKKALPCDVYWGATRFNPWTPTVFIYIYMYDIPQSSQHFKYIFTLTTRPYLLLFNFVQLHK